jgi:excisionase family DNA binding protein
VEQLLSLSHAAARLGIGRSTLKRLVAHRRVTVVRVGRRLLFEPDALQRFVQAHSIPEQSAATRRRGASRIAEPDTARGQAHSARDGR